MGRVESGIAFAWKVSFWCIRTCLICLALLTAPSWASAADFSYEIYDPREDSADDYIVSSQNLVIVAEPDFVYWRTSNSTEPHVLLFHFPFDREVDTANLAVRTDTFNWNRDAYTRIEASKDGTNWVLLLETGPPDYGGWNSGTYSGDLPASLLGGTDIYVRVTLSVYLTSGAPANSNNAQALRHQPSVNNRTFALNVDFKGSQAETGGLPLAAILMLLEDSPALEDRTEALDPVAVGGAGTKIIYAGQTYSGATNIVPNSLVGIEKDGQYYLYHPAMGTGVAFSEATNKRAFLYAMLTFGSDYGAEAELRAQTEPLLQSGTEPLLQSGTEPLLRSGAGLVFNGTQSVQLPSGVTVKMAGKQGEITLTNELSRWVGVKVNRGGTSTLHYLAPRTHLAWDLTQVAKAAAGYVFDYSKDGNVFTFNALTVDSFELFGAAARTLPLNVVSGWPTYCDRAVSSDKALFVRVCVLDYFSVFWGNFRNILNALFLLECGDGIIDFMLAQIEKYVLSTVVYDERLREAIEYEGGVSLLIQFMSCLSVAGSSGASEVGFSLWDIAKVFGDFVEDVPAGMLTERFYDAYTYVKLVGLNDLAVASPPTKTEYVAGEALNLSGTILRATYDSSPFNSAITRGFTYGADGFDLDVSITPEPGTSLTTGNDRVVFNTLYPDIRYLSYDAGVAILGVSKDPAIDVTQAITVTEDSGSRCASPVIANSITIPGYGGGNSVTLHFGSTYKMCTETVADPDSMNGETVMLYFFKTDGSGTYSQPLSGGSGSSYNFAHATVSGAYNNLNVSVSPLPDFNSSTVSYYDPETNFGYRVVNYETLSESNAGDFLWLKVQAESGGSWTWTIVNTEWLEADGSYTGNY